MDKWSAGDWGGAFAGFVAAAAALAKGLAWLLNWNEARSDGREARLISWEHNLVNREKAYREEIEQQLHTTRVDLARVVGEVSVLRGLLVQVTAELHRHAPESAVLAHVATVLGDKT